MRNIEVAGYGFRVKFAQPLGYKWSLKDLQSRILSDPKRTARTAVFRLRMWVVDKPGGQAELRSAVARGEGRLKFTMGKHLTHMLIDRSRKARLA